MTKGHGEADSLVFVVDDDASVRQALTSLLRSVALHVEAFGSVADFLKDRRLGNGGGAACLILDVRLPGTSGLDFQAELARTHTHLPIIFITGHGDVPTIVQAMKAGAVEFLTKPYSSDVILPAIQNAIERSRAALGHQAKERSIRDHYQSLSRREREVMALVVSGRLNKQVGGELGISEITVKAHRGNVMRKMKAGSIADLVRMATSLEIVPAL